MATKDERLKELFDNEESTMKTILRHVSAGGSIIDLCETWDVPYADVWLWIRDEKKRFHPYNDALNARNEWGKEQILFELKRIGMADIRKLYDDNGNILPVKDWPNEVASFVSSIEQVEEFDGSGKDREQVGWVKKVKLWNKEKALELLGKNIHMFNEHHTHSGKITLEDLVADSRGGDDENKSGE